MELRKHMGWYLGHFPGAKLVRNELVRINSLADVERIIATAVERQDEEGEGVEDVQMEEVGDAELDVACAC